MISISELEKLIEIEKVVRPGDPHDSYLGFDYYRPNAELELQYLKEFKTNFASNFLLESYCWRTFEYVNNHLRRTCGVPLDEFVKEYQFTLNKLLDEIESYNDQIAWRWDNCNDGFEYLKLQKGKRIQIPEFKSTSERKLLDRIYWRIETHSNSNGKMIFKHIDHEKARAEKEILFKSNSRFNIVDVDTNCIYLKEIHENNIDLVLCENYWLK